MYAGFRFRTCGSQVGMKYDDSHIRYDYKKEGGSQRMASAFGKIVRMFTHELHAHGPERVVVECEWYRTMVAKNPISGNTVVRLDPTYLLFDKFVFLQDCYQQPVALWPFDPFEELPRSDPRKNVFEVLDRNQTEAWGEQ
jgi:hypothetical protein